MPSWCFHTLNGRKLWSSIQTFTTLRSQNSWGKGKRGYRKIGPEKKLTSQQATWEFQEPTKAVVFVLFYCDITYWWAGTIGHHLLPCHNTPFDWDVRPPCNFRSNVQAVNEKISVCNQSIFQVEATRWWNEKAFRRRSRSASTASHAG